MAKFTKQTNTATAEVATESVKGTPRVTRCNLVNFENRPGLVAFANVIYEGTVFMQSIAVRENANGDAYITFPNKKRVDREGKDVLDENGKVIYDAYYGPADAETRKALEEMIYTAVQDKINGVEPAETEKGANKAMVHLVQDNDKGLVAMVNVVFTGKFFMTGITVNEVQGGENAGNAYLGFPSRKRTRNGADVLDENGKTIWDAYYGPASKESKEALEKMIFTAVQDEITKAEQAA